MTGKRGQKGSVARLPGVNSCSWPDRFYLAVIEQPEQKAKETSGMFAASLREAGARGA
jgi:hypothetical protein